MAIIVLFVGLLVFLAHLFTALFEKTRIPDVLPLVFLGVLLGPVFGWVTPENFGKAGAVFTFISLTIILFESGLGLDFATLRECMLPGIRLTILNFAASVAVVTAIMLLTGKFSLIEGMMLGAILGGTSSAVVIPMVCRLPMGEHSRTVLLLESTFSDVLCIVVTLALLQTIRYNELRLGHMAGQIISSFSLAAVIGFIGAVFWSNILERVRKLENSIFTTPAFVFVIYGVSEIFGFSGAISALSFGVTLGNIGILQAQVPLLRRIMPARAIHLNEIEKTFFSEVVFLLKTFFFVYIGLSMRLGSPVLLLAGLGLSTSLFVVRIPVIYASLGLSTPRFDAAIASAMVPKGLAAAVLASLPMQMGIAHGGAIQDIVYAVVLFSITSTSILIFLIEKGQLARLTGFVLSRFPPARTETT